MEEQTRKMVDCICWKRLFEKNNPIFFYNGEQLRGTRYFSVCKTCPDLRGPALELHPDPTNHLIA